MRNLPYLFIAVLLLGWQPAWGQRAIRLTVGRSEQVSVKGTVTKVQVLNPSVADVASSSTRGASIVGVGPGSTELIITTTRRRFKYSVVVTGVEVGQLFKQVRTFLGRIEGIYPRLIGDTIVISGTALTADDFGRAQRAVKLFGNHVKNLVRFRPSAIAQINEIFRQSGLHDVRARLVGGTLFLEGTVDSKHDGKKVDALLRSYGLAGENLVKIGGGRQILVDVHFVELKKRNLQNLGIQWPASAAVQGEGTVRGNLQLSPRSGDNVFLDLSSKVTVGRASINLLLSNGYGRLLAQPKLVCGSGKSAEFVVGGEIPMVVVTQNTSSVTYKPFGIQLKIKPVASSLDTIETEIHAEVSAPDGTLTVQNVPGFRTRRFKTSVSVKNGAPIVLSGLFTNNQTKQVEKLPLLGQIPIIGELFKSRDFQQEKTTLVVFVTPRVVSPEHPWVQKTIRDIQRLYREYESEVGWQVFD